MLEILDTSLRDGAQHYGISYSNEDKLSILSLLDNLGISFVELANASSNVKDTAFLSQSIATKSCKLVAFGSTHKKNLTAATDASLKALASCKIEYISVFGKSSATQVTQVLQTTLANNIDMISNSIKYLKDNNHQVIFDAEHFYDGYKIDKAYALDTILTAYKSGANRIILCDTNGSSYPEDIFEATKTVVSLLPQAIIGIHCHNDNGLATANSLSAIRAGATHLQGTLLGIGERCGNASLSELLPSLVLRYGIKCLTPEQLSNLTPTAQAVAEISNISIPSSAPYIGENAFAHKAGMHADGVIKNPLSFEHISPNVVGNTRHLLLSEVSGRGLVVNKLKPFYNDIDKDSPIIEKIIFQLKQQENLGYQYESAEASFLLLAHKVAGKFISNFELVSYKVDISSVDNSSSTATITYRVNNTNRTATSVGDGPVHALDLAMRQCLASFYPILASIFLTDYKVRVINPHGATGAKVRVLMTTSDGKKSWSTVGVDTDIIRASFLALSDSYEYKLNNLLWRNS